MRQAARRSAMPSASVKQVESQAQVRANGLAEASPARSLEFCLVTAGSLPTDCPHDGAAATA
jgi:hypothetical protein